jgi:DNA-binding MarR family transcriptional regulator
MQPRDPRDQARYIFTTGKKIHDRILRIQAAHLAGAGRPLGCGDLSMPQLQAVMLVRKIGTVSVSELASRLGVSAPSASNMVDRLVEKGLLLRKPSATDRRRVDVHVAPRALQNLAELEDAVISYFVSLVERLGPETSGKWCEVLSSVDAVLEAEDATPSSTPST